MTYAVREEGFSWIRVRAKTLEGAKRAAVRSQLYFSRYIFVGRMLDAIHVRQIASKSPGQRWQRAKPEEQPK